MTVFEIYGPFNMNVHQLNGTLNEMNISLFCISRRETDISNLIVMGFLFGIMQSSTKQLASK